MWHTSSIIPDADSTVRVYVSGEIPVVQVEGDHGNVTIHVPHATPSEAAEWLRDLASQASDLADELTVRDLEAASNA